MKKKRVLEEDEVDITSPERKRKDALVALSTKRNPKKRICEQPLSEKGILYSI